MQRLLKDAIHSVSLSYAKAKRKNRSCKIAVGFVFSIFVAAFHFSSLNGAESQTTAHPAVVRVIASETKQFSCGSGSLIGKRENYGYVITNWHVVRDSNGSVFVQYPDGTSASAVVIGVDSLWDIALLATPSPNIDPIRITSTPPQKGDTLYLAGYGDKNIYRIASGICTQYVSPAPGKEKELIEFSAVARPGDSGGPIFNKNAEIVGVLFGTDNTITMGSYYGRLLKFLNDLAPYVEALPKDPKELIAQASKEKRTILQRSRVEPSFATQTLPPIPSSENTAPPLEYRQSSVSSFGGGGSKKRKSSESQPQVDYFQTVQEIQPQLGFQGFKYGEAPVASPLASPVAGYPRSSPNASTMSLPTNIPPAAASATTTVVPPGTPPNATNAITYSSATSTPSYSAYRPAIPPPSASVGTGTSLPPVSPHSTSNLNRTPSGTQGGTQGISQAATSLPPINTGIRYPEAGAAEAYKNSKGTEPQKRQDSNSYLSNSYGSNTASPADHSYAMEVPELIASVPIEKYGESYSPGMGSSAEKSGTTRSDAIKIIGAIIVIFFILFHAVKMMSLIEEK